MAISFISFSLEYHDYWDNNIHSKINEPHSYYLEYHKCWGSLPDKKSQALEARAVPWCGYQKGLPRRETGGSWQTVWSPILTLNGARQGGSGKAWSQPSQRQRGGEGRTKSWQVGECCSHSSLSTPQGQEFSNTDERCQAKKFENRINTYVCTHTHTHTHTFLRTS